MNTWKDERICYEHQLDSGNYFFLLDKLTTVAWHLLPYINRQFMKDWWDQLLATGGRAIVRPDREHTFTTDVNSAWVTYLIQREWTSWPTTRCWAWTRDGRRVGRWSDCSSCEPPSTPCPSTPPTWRRSTSTWRTSSAKCCWNTKNETWLRCKWIRKQNKGRTDRDLGLRGSQRPEQQGLRPCMRMAGSL